jgi:two-component system chemotaxis response regulator CheB
VTTGAKRDVVVVGASAGGVEALTRFVGGLPADLPAAVLVVLHIPARAPSALPVILARNGPLPARTAGEDEPLVPGTILVAPPDHHLVIRETGATVVRGPRENGHRPSIDSLFRTAAVHLGPRVVGVVLSGSDDDGTSGAVAVRQRGGTVAIQAPDDAMYRTMPASVARRARPVAAVPADQLGALVADLVREAPGPESPERDLTLVQEAAVNENLEDAVLGERRGEPSGYSCPDCSGVLFVQSEDPVLRFRCRIGHSWTGDGLVAEQDLTVETALWSAVRTLQEKAELSERLAHRALDDGRRVSANHFHEAASEARQSAGVLRELLSSAALGRYSAEGAGQITPS